MKKKHLLSAALSAGLVIQLALPLAVYSQPPQIVLPESTVRLGAALYPVNEYPASPTTALSVTVPNGNAQTTVSLQDKQKQYTYTTATCNEQGVAQIFIPDTLAGGDYLITSSTGAESPIALLENVVHGLEVKTDVAPNPNNQKTALTDGTILDWNAASDPKPSAENPQCYDFDLAETTRINGFTIWCGLGTKHGVKSADFYTKTKDGEWTKQGSFNFEWQDGADRIPNHITLPNEVEADSVRLAVTDSGYEWGNNSVMAELQIWGESLSDTPIEPPVPPEPESPSVPDNKNTANKLSFSVSGFSEPSGELSALQDGNSSTVWSAKLAQNTTGQFFLNVNSPEKSQPKTMLTDSLCLVSATDPAGLSVSVNANCNGDSHYATVSKQPASNWSKQADGTWICNVDLVGLFQTTDLKVSVENKGTDKSISFAEIKVGGKVLESNALTAKANVFVDGSETPIDISGMSNNRLNSTTSISAGANSTKELVFEFSEFPAQINGFSFSANFPQQQGVKKFDLAYWNGSQWVDLAKDVAPAYHQFSNENDKQLRQAYELLFDSPITTNKLKFTAKECPAAWGGLIFEEFNLYGSLLVSAKGLADSIASIPQPKIEDTKLTLPTLPDEYASAYTVSIASTGDPSVISTDGTIHPQQATTTVDVTLKVSANDGSDSALTVPLPVTVHAVKEDYIVVHPTEDKESFLKNPAIGWVQYVEGFECRKHGEGQSMPTDLCTTDPSDINYFWSEMDKLIEQGLAPSILYMRMQWSWFEPQEGVYAWDDPTSELYQLVEGARKRNIDLAFRVLVDSQDIGEFQATPEWLFENYDVSYAPSTDNFKTPHADHPVFLEKYGNFIKAFAEEFDKEDVAFIDTCGLGNWGEMHNIIISGQYGKNINDVVDEISKMYADAFQNVLVGAQIGGSFSREAIQKYDFVMRRDSYGSPMWLPQGDINEIRTNVEKGIPMFAENCYHHFVTREGRWSSVVGPSYGDDVYKTMDAMMRGVMDHALATRANTLDIRVLEDARQWVALNDEFGFIEEGFQKLGYRFSPVSLSVPTKLEPGESVEIYHSWKNSGVGFLPNKNPRWGNKFHISFALLDKKTGTPVYQFNESTDRVNPGDWMQEDGEIVYNSNFALPSDIAAGTYDFAVGIVNSKQNYQPEIQLATTLSAKNNWYIVGDVSVGTKTPPVDNSQLNESIKIAESFNPADYSADVWAAFSEVLNHARAVFADPNSTQAEIDKANEELKQAIKKLEQTAPTPTPSPAPTATPVPTSSPSATPAPTAAPAPAAPPSTNSSTPQTGDSFQPVWNVFALLAAGCTAAFAFINRKKNSQK